jgi:serine/threonine protein kinase
MIALPGIAIQEKIYESANSLVYRGIRDDGQTIVIKRLKEEYPSPQELTRYRQEYEITRSLNLEGVIKAYSQQDYQRTLVILLEDFGGESLEQWMRRRSDFCPMPLATFLRLAIALTDILSRIHADNIIHKDINPGNIVLNQLQVWLKSLTSDCYPIQSHESHVQKPSCVRGHTCLPVTRGKPDA